MEWRAPSKDISSTDCTLLPRRQSDFCNRTIAFVQPPSEEGGDVRTIGLRADAIHTLELHQTSFIILMILVSVAPIDYVSDPLRFAVIGRRGVVA